MLPLTQPAADIGLGRGCRTCNQSYTVQYWVSQACCVNVPGAIFQKYFEISLYMVEKLPCVA